MSSITITQSYHTLSSFLHNNGGFTLRRRSSPPHYRRKFAIKAKLAQNTLQYRKLGDSDLLISEITLGTMTFGEQNTEKESHDILSYAFDQGINILDTAEAYPIPMKKETQGRTDLYIASWLKSQPRDKVIIATKVCGYSERSGYIRDNANVLRVDRDNIKESVEKSLKRLNTDYIDLLQIHWPDRYVAMFGEFSYDFNKWRESVPFEEQLKALQEVIDEGKVRYIGVSNETSYGVMEFVHAAKSKGLPKIISIQNCYNLVTRCKFEVDLVEVCHPNNYNIGLLAYSPLGGGILSGKYLDPNSQAAKKGRLNLFPGYMERYINSYSKKRDEGEINEDILHNCFKKLATEKMTYLYRCKGKEMEPTIYDEETLCVRKFPYPIVKPKQYDENIRVGDVVVLKDPSNSENHVVRRLVAIGGYEMTSSNKEDEPFVLDDDQCWVLSDNSKLTPKDSNDSRSYGPISITHIVGRAMFRFGSFDRNGFILNHKVSMKNDMSVMFIELDSGELLNHKDEES